MATDTYEEILISEILLDNDFNCRGVFDNEQVIELANDIREHGLIQPVVVTPHGLDPTHEGYKYLLVAGYMRTTACKLLEHKTIKAIVRHDIKTREHALVLNLAENVQRSSLTILQEARVIGKMRYELNMNYHDIAKAVNKSTGWVQPRLDLLELPEDVQGDADKGLLTQTNIKDLHSIQKHAGSDAMYEAVRKIKGSSKPSNVKIRETDKPTVTKRVRNKREMAEMRNKIYDTYGANIATRVLAWTTGEITTEALEESCKEELVPC